jgi:hypothetical protein
MELADSVHEADDEPSCLQLVNNHGVVDELQARLMTIRGVD